MKKCFILFVLLFVCALAMDSAEGAPAVGEYATLGAYEQDNDPNNGPEPIEWLVLDVQEGRALLISRYVLDGQPLHEVKDDDTWESYGVVYWDRSSLRAWLNGDFLNAVFTPEEQARILLTDVDNSEAQGWQGWQTRACDTTQDYVFALSFHEVMDLYFADGEARRCGPTEYAMANGAFSSDTFQADGRNTGYWWLRTPINGHDYHGGAVSNVGNPDYVFAFATDVGVRPVLWLRLD